MESERDGPSIEDGDPLVVAVARCKNLRLMVRRPGLLMFGFESVMLVGNLIVMRSRFEGNYGNICRMTHHTEEGGAAERTYAPTVAVLAAVTTDEPAAAIEKLFEQWMKKGE